MLSSGHRANGGLGSNLQNSNQAYCEDVEHQPTDVVLVVAVSVRPQFAVGAG